MNEYDFARAYIALNDNNIYDSSYALVMTLWAILVHPFVKMFLLSLFNNSSNKVVEEPAFYALAYLTSGLLGLLIHGVVILAIGQVTGINSLYNMILNFWTG